MHDTSGCRTLQKSESPVADITQELPAQGA
jgi:hypothetical protein